MYKKTITFPNYNGEEVTESFYFNLTKAELLEMEMEQPGGMMEYLNTLIESKDANEILKIFKNLIRRSVGKKSADGRRFVKNEEITNDFMQTEAYSQLFMELATDAEEGARFINGIIPQDVAKEVAKEKAKDSAIGMIAPAT